jgi:excinuclease ABC subunit B
MSEKFILEAPFKPAGDQPKAIAGLVAGVENKLSRQTLVGTTGSGKTMTMASVIAETQKPALVISHNKTLAAQLASEFKDFFPQNAVEYFVSYYDYYQPEAYIPRTDTYIAKDSAINDEIDRLRHSAMEVILTRRDVVVVASVSCIYGIGSAADYMNARLQLTVGQPITRQDVLRHLTQLQYLRNDVELDRGRFRVRGDTVDIHPASEDKVIRLEFFGPTLERLVLLDSLTGEVLGTPPSFNIFPATFFTTTPEKQKNAMGAIREELAAQIQYFKKIDKLVEAQRIEQRVTYDLEMIENIGYVSGIENYSRHLDGRLAGQPPSTLIDYFIHHYGRDGFLTFIDESHMSVPQIGAMYEGDKARKKALIEYGFRLPSAADNRPLQFHEFEDRIGQTIFVSATPAKYEYNTSKQIVEQIVRPTGLLDPVIAIKPTGNQVDDVIDEVQERITHKQRVLITTLTKRMAEELATYLVEIGIKAAYIHSDIDTLERLEILRDLRLGTYDAVVGINLLREGLDLPEVSLVAIMDADKEGYLRSQTALIQIMGRAARHLEGKVIMYADKVTGSMQRAIEETTRRRAIQEAYNLQHNITPRSVEKAIKMTRLGGAKSQEELEEIEDIDEIPPDERARIIKELTSKMELASSNLDFEKAARLRDVISAIRQKEHASRAKKRR